MNKLIKLSIFLLVLVFLTGASIALACDCNGCKEPCDCKCPPEPPCPPPIKCDGVGTPGYWKNHFEDWPLDAICFEDSSGWGICVDAESILERIMKPVKGNKCITLLKALVAAKLNVASGCLDTCIEDTIAYADDWYLDNCGTDGSVKASSKAWYYAEPLYFKLDDYNNGKLCAFSRD